MVVTWWIVAFLPSAKLCSCVNKSELPCNLNVLQGVVYRFLSLR